MFAKWITPPCANRKSSACKNSKRERDNAKVQTALDALTRAAETGTGQFAGAGH